MALTEIISLEGRLLGGPLHRFKEDRVYFQSIVLLAIQAFKLRRVPTIPPVSEDIKELVSTLPRELPKILTVGQILACLELYPLDLLGQRMFTEFILISKLARMYADSYSDQFTSGRIAFLYSEFIDCQFEFPLVDFRDRPWPVFPGSWKQ